MPRNSAVNKSEMIREVIRKDPQTKVRDIVAQLGAKGVKVATSMVYTVKSMMKKQSRKELRQKVATTTGNSNPIQLVRRVKELAAEVGGIGKLKELVQVLSE